MRALLRPAVAVTAATIDDAPSAKGAYVLLLRLDGPLAVTLRHHVHALAPGWYAYAGSANGPGGLRARLRRHFREDKRFHWHVDPLTVAAGAITAFAIPGAVECDLATRLERRGAFRHALSGFGSSDCRTCRSHLLEWIGGAARA